MFISKYSVAHFNGKYNYLFYLLLLLACRLKSSKRSACRRCISASRNFQVHLTNEERSGLNKATPAVSAVLQASGPGPNAGHISLVPRQLESILGLIAIVVSR